MNRLQAELQRLAFASEGAGVPTPDANPEGGVRTMVLELAGPGAWDALGKVWQGVQAELHWPAPGIAVSGRDGYQLWFSLADVVPAEDAAALLEALRKRYLADVARHRVRVHPADAAGGKQVLAAPPAETEPGRWSAFIAPDLAALFAEEPWLDLAPSPDAQADLLARLQSTTAAQWREAWERVRPAAERAFPAAGAPPAATGLLHQDPRRFLLEVMNDPAVELQLRIEAAKALLPCGEGRSDL
jgi:hypothetical protein